MFNLYFQYRTLFHIYKLLDECANLEYVLIKKDKSFPLIGLQSDFDIITTNMDVFVEKVLYYFSLISNYKIKVNEKNPNKIHIDIFNREKFLYKFDLNSNIENNRITKNNSDLISLAINEKYVYSFQFLFKSFVVNIPKLEIETLFRLIEHDCFPEKKHHKIFIDVQKESTITNINANYSNFLKNKISR